MTEPIKVRRLIELLQQVDPELDVWATHPEHEIQWGPITGVGVAITDRFQRVALIATHDSDNSK
jgi:hypothetical protein